MTNDVDVDGEQTLVLLVMGDIAEALRRERTEMCHSTLRKQRVK